MAKTVSKKPKKAPVKKAPAKKTAAKPRTAAKATAKTEKAVQKAAKKETPAAAPAEAETSIFTPLVTLRRQIDDLVEDAFARFPQFSMPRIEWPAFPKGEDEAELAIAHFDFSENDNAVKVTADVPGMSEEDIDVSVENGMLTIKGEKKSEREQKDEDFYLSERRFGSFSRAFRLPEGVKEDDINAQFKKGVLTVTMPKAATEKKAAKRINVKPG